MGEITVKEINYGSLGRCVELANGEIDLVVTLDYGPRIVRFGFIGGENEFRQDAPLVIGSDYGEWRIIGGHRLTHSPESVPRTYMPDNNPVKYSRIPNGIKVTQEMEPWTQIIKELEITFKPGENAVQILQELTNKNAWPVELAVWGITVMNTGGKELIPLTRKDTGALPNRSLILWPYSNLMDKRFHLFNKYILLEQSPSITQSFKLGINNEEGWAAYINHNNLFIKRFEYQAGKNYPDLGSSYETYADGTVLEMEALTSIEKLNVNESLQLSETWELVKNVSLGDISEEAIDKLVEKYIL